MSLRPKSLEYFISTPHWLACLQPAARTAFELSRRRPQSYSREIKNFHLSQLTGCVRRQSPSRPVPRSLAVRLLHAAAGIALGNDLRRPLVVAAAGITYVVATLPQKPASGFGDGYQSRPADADTSGTARPPATLPISNVPAIPAQPSVTEAAQAWDGDKGHDQPGCFCRISSGNSARTPYGSMARARLQELQAAVLKTGGQGRSGEPGRNRPREPQTQHGDRPGGGTGSNGAEPVFKLDGTVRAGSNSGTWTCSDGNYVVSWSVGGWVDRIRISNRWHAARRIERY